MIDYSYWRLWHEGSQVRVARDKIEDHEGGARQLTPEHLEVVGDRVEWVEHREGAPLPAVPLPDFIDWLELGGW